MATSAFASPSTLSSTACSPGPPFADPPAGDSQVDIRDYDGLAAALHKGVNEFGRLDIVASNAAMSGVGSLAAEMTEHD
jgi:NAD(P)-dependent dehydrogenase (short-subunit alcohol dehydrogenase family)